MFFPTALRRARIAPSVPALLAGLAWLVVASLAIGAPGDLDPSFGTGGLVVTDLPSYSDALFDLVVQPDGKIVVAGYIPVPSSTFFPTDAFLLMRFDEQGGRDASFGNDGVVMTVVTRSRVTARRC